MSELRLSSGSLRKILPVLFGAVLVALFYGRLVFPSQVPYSRDDPFLVLPQLTTLHRTIEHGIPWWNPWRGGGQPILSNPHYAAFYPPTWITFLLPPHYALNLLLLFHALLAFAGAWVLARHLGASRTAACLAAVGFTCGGVALSLAELFNLFCGMAWFPWIIYAGDRLLAAPSSSWLRPAILAALALAFQILNGDPASVVMSGMMLAALALTRAERRQSLARLAALAAIALLLASVQLLPTWFRWRESPRSHGLTLASAGLWSTPPARLAEIALPRLYGNPGRDEENLFFGWRINDRSYPLLTSIYPGAILLLLAIGGLAAGGLPRRGAWMTAIAAGLFLALGRHNPLFAPLHNWIPVLAVQRYPEKFMALAMSAVVFAGALSWDRVRGRCGAIATGAGSILLLTYAFLSAFAWIDPGAVARFARSGSMAPWNPSSLARAVGFLRREAVVGLLIASGATVLLFLLSRRKGGRVVAAAALLLFAADLVHYNRGLDPTVATSWLLAPPPLTSELPAASAGRIFLTPTPKGERAPAMRVGRPGFYQLRDTLASFAPFSANLWGAAYALNKDYDLMATGWSRYARALAVDQSGHPEQMHNLLAAWNVTAVVSPRPPAERLRELRAGIAYPPPVTVASNSDSLPRYRFVPAAGTFTDWRQAIAAANDQQFDVAGKELLIDPQKRSIEVTPGARLTRIAETPARVAIDYRAPGPALLVAAMTFDPGWRASVDGALLPTLPTALGQIAIPVPAGSHRMLLRYHDPWVGIGGALTLLALLAAIYILLETRANPAHQRNA